VLFLVTTEKYRPDEPWQRLVAMGDARFALDTGEDIEQGRVALLASVDVRTVRNAASTGELRTVKDAGLTLIENASARRWLATRRGFRPTEVNNASALPSLDLVLTPADFAGLLQIQRKHLGVADAEARQSVLHPSATPAALAQLEGGVFMLPLDAVFPVADFYRLPRSEFLACVMRVFFREEFDTIVDCVVGRIVS
jgi:hypothetical protein